MPVYTNPIYINVRRRHFKTIAGMKTDMSGRLQEWGYVEDDDYFGVLKSDATSWRWFSRSKLFEPGNETNERVTAGVNDIVINEPGDDVNLRVESNTHQNALYMDGQYGNWGFHTATIPDWDHDNYHAIKLGNGTHAAHIYSGNNDWGGTQNAYYDETDTRWEYIAAARASRWYMDDGVWMVQSAGVGAAADDPITWIDLISTFAAEVVINDGQVDVDLRVETDNEEYALFVEGSSDNVGMGTSEPLLNLTGTAAFDLSGHGLHILSDDGQEANLVIEGWPSNGDGGGRLFLIDRGGAANDKTISFEMTNAGVAAFHSWNDDGTLRTGNLLDIDLGSGFVAVGAVPTTAAFEVSSVTGALRVPRMTTAERNAITAANGDIIYNTTDNKFQGYENGGWANLI